MSTYKVIQDIESEDKLIGPLSPRQFAYGAITAFCLWMCYVSISRGAAFLVVIFIPPGLLAGFFAFPWGREQTTEVWALARVRFLFKPRKRVWNQDGAKELVTITVPKKIEKHYTDGLSELEVKSRLQALATTIDSRGWAIKNTVINPYSVNPVFVSGQQSSQRLVDIDSSAVQPSETTVEDDILDSYNPRAKEFSEKLVKNAEEQRARLIASMQSNDQPMQTSQPTSTTASDDSIIRELDESARLKEQQNSKINHVTIQPLSESSNLPAEDANPSIATTQTELPSDPEPPVTQEQEAVILNLAHRDDLNISTIERTAKKVADNDQDEVVISLH